MKKTQFLQEIPTLLPLLNQAGGHCPIKTYTPWVAIKTCRCQQTKRRYKMYKLHSFAANY
ncbi:hypothetical protein PTKIN_Ptkin15bG0105800 [Pterospermum kingtungense]